MSPREGWLVWFSKPSPVSNSPSGTHTASPLQREWITWLENGSSCFASKMGQLAGNHFLTVVEGAEQLHEMGRTVLWKGAQWIRFTDLGER